MNNSIVMLRRFDYTEARQVLFRNHMIQVRTYTTMRVTSWFPSWLTQWRQPQPVQPLIQQEPTGGEQRDPRRLTVDQLVLMMGDSGNYRVHGTPNPDVGMLREPLVGFEDSRFRISNYMAPVGVYAFTGIIGAYEMGYGPYYVIMDASKGNWIRQGAHWYRAGEEAIPADWIVGYCLDEDIREAKRKRGK